MSVELTEQFKDEAAKDQNRPIELYDIYLGSQDVCDEQTYHFCTTNKRISFFDLDGEEENYLPLRIKREAMPSSNQLEVEMFAGEFDNTDLAWSSWVSTVDLRAKRVVVRKVFLDLLDDPTQAKIIFDGIINGVAEISEASVKINVRSKLKSLSIQPGALQGLYCIHIFGDELCAFNIAATRSSGQTVDAGSSVNEIIDAARAEADDYWNDGVILFTSGQNAGERRKIVDFISAEHRIVMDFSLFYVPAEGDQYTIERGCDKSLTVCTGRFGNQANFLGFPFIPQLINPIKG